MFGSHINRDSCRRLFGEVVDEFIYEFEMPERHFGEDYQQTFGNEAFIGEGAGNSEMEVLRKCYDRSKV